MECGPGEEAQVDFGSGAPVITPDGKRRKTNVFRIVLSHSRKAYSEATFTQTTEDFFRCLENAFAHFGGVPKTLGDRQPEGGRRASRLVRSRTDAEGAIVLSALRHGDSADEAVHAAAQGQGRVGREVREEQRAQGEEVREPGRRESLPGRLGADDRRHAHSRHDEAAGRQAVRRGTADASAVAAGTVRLLPRSAAEGQPRRPRRSGQGVLLGAAGVSGPRSLGAVGRAAGAHLQSPLRADRGARAARAGSLQHARRAHRAREDQRPGTRRRAICCTRSASSARSRGSGRRRWSTPAASKARGCCKGCSR